MIRPGHLGWLRAIVVVAACAPLLSDSTSLAATSVDILGISNSGSVLTVTGEAAFDDAPFVQVGTDPAHDAVPPGPSGLDLTHADIRTLADGHLVFRWSLTGLPPMVDGLDMTFLGWSFCVVSAETENCYEVDAGRYYHSQWPPLEQAEWSGQVWECADDSCNWGEQTATSIPVEVAVENAPGSPATVSVSFPGSPVGASPGTVLTPVSVYPGGAAFATVWQWHEKVEEQTLPGSGVYPFFGDGLTIGTDYTIPGQTVSVALAEPGADPEDVDYNISARMDANGGFTGSISTGGLTGAQAVYARACFGAGSCAFASRDVTL